MRKICKYLCVGVLTVSFVLSGLGGLSESFAKTKAELEKEQAELNSQINSANADLNATRTQKNITLEEIAVIDSELAAVSEKLDFITNSLAEKRVELTQIETELGEAEEKRDIQYEAFKQRSRYIYMNGSMSYVDVIFSAKSVTDLVKRIDYVNRIVEYDKDLVSSLQESEAIISTKLDETQKQKDDLEVMELLATNQKKDYDETLAQKSALIETLKLDEAEYQRQVDQLSSSSDSIEAELKKIADDERRQALAVQTLRSASSSSVSVYTYDGNPLQWPLPGRTGISSPFGNRTSPISGRSEFHTGVDIPAPYGTSVLAAEGGTVVTAGWVNGYGNTVIINHGNGITTLYGHNSSLTVSQGQTIERGSTIAKVGSTGWSTGNHVHFEVRQNGTPSNPLNYTTAR
ncbi:MAG: peptidoglycan DD-metalloendopeptidase family protein [Clostridiales bacterium]|nr:peptidoglycan DD-metalloendopeptidase family protein [Clostridiales bacterium]